MSKTISVPLSAAGISQLQKELEDYKKNLITKCETFVTRLAEKGISIGQQNCGVFTGKIAFSKTVNNTNGYAVAVMSATSSPETVTWFAGKDGEHSEEIIPLLMAEFGSGWKSENRWGMAGVGQGTLNKYGHAEDPDGWWWKQTEDGPWIHSYGTTPTTPMFRAWSEMYMNIRNIAKEVFG